MLRQALASDIPGIQRVRPSVRENRLVSTVIPDEAAGWTLIGSTGQGELGYGLNPESANGYKHSTEGNST